VIHEQTSTVVKGGFWLGAEDILEGKWQWQADNSGLSFTDWSKGQPNNSGGNEDCMHLYDRFNFDWNNSPCISKVGFICERPMVRIFILNQIPYVSSS